MRGPRTMAPARAIQPPTECDHAGAGEVSIAVAQTEVRAKLCQPSAAPGPVADRWDRSGSRQKNPKTQNAENFQRSAMAPVGMVAAVSMNTIWNRNMTAIATS